MPTTRTTPDPDQSADLRASIAAKHAQRLLGRLPKLVEGNIFDLAHDDVVIDVANETWARKAAS